MTYRPEMPIVTKNVTVGFTTDIEALGTVSAPVTYVFDLDTPQLKTMTMDGGAYTFNVPDPAGDIGGACEVYITATTSDSTVTAGTNVSIINGSPYVLTAGNNYVLNIKKFGSAIAVMQFIPL